MTKPINIGDTVICTHSASPWFTVDQRYEVVEHPEGHGKAIVASDGLHDLLSMATSKFEKVTS